MDTPPRGLRVALAALVLVGVAQIGLPLSPDVRAWAYVGVAVAAICVAVAGVFTYRPAKPLAWWLVIVGFAGWVIADAQWTVETYITKPDGYPVVSDAIYLPAYLIIVAGLLVMLWLHRGSDSRGSVLDGTIIATGSAVFVTSVLIVPMAKDDSLTPFGVVVSAAYPVGDVMLLVAAMLLWATPGIRSRSFMWLFASLVASFLPDMAWAAFSHDPPERLSNAIWLAVYVLVAFAAADPSMRVLGTSTASGYGAKTSRRRLALLGIGLIMPACATLTADASNRVPLVGAGTVAISLLILARMAGLLNVIQAQAVQLAALANRDVLTGAPNRRTWDHELSTACRDSKENGTPLAIAMLDIDHFKKFNDARGHQAGDLLLREAVAAWSDVLGNRGILARYGGEEFAVLLPQHDIDEAVNMLYALRAVTPSNQSFSAGVTLWDPNTEPGAALAQADRCMYDAKRAGRDRVVAFPDTKVTASMTIPMPEVVVQPIVDLFTGEVTAHEALSRFNGRSPQSVFQLAAQSGYGDILEARALVAAVSLPGRPPGQPLHVNASAAALRSERFWSIIPTDLTGIVVEISEEYDGAAMSSLASAVDRLRARGAKIATDDLGSGSNELVRLATVRPDIVKLDRDLVNGCATDPGRRAVIVGGLAFSQALGSEIVAEGASAIDDLLQLRALGVRLAQCFLLGEPSPSWAPSYVPLPFAVIANLR
jgi:diguanylate cyclase (GGDEF)-like protein